jgi:hypothetical protein
MVNESKLFPRVPGWNWSDLPSFTSSFSGELYVQIAWRYLDMRMRNEGLSQGPCLEISEE